MLAFVTKYGLALICFLIGLLFLCSAYKDMLRNSGIKKDWKIPLAVVIAIVSVVAFAIGWFVGSVI